jgi:hypothetical protein
MSSIDGSGGESRMPSAMSDSATSDASSGSPVLTCSAWRRSHSVSNQISPSECTSGAPAILPKSPSV